MPPVSTRSPTPNPQALRKRLQRLKERPLDFIASSRFGGEGPPAATGLVAEVEAGEHTPGVMGGQGLPAHLRRLCATPLLSADDEQQFFFHMNYCKYHAAAVLASIHPSRPTEEKLDEAEDYLTRAERLRNYLLQANTRLIVSIARKYADARNSFDDMLSSGLTSVVRAVEKFDCERGYRFSTYATCAVRRDLHRLVMNRRRMAQRFVGATGDLLETLPDGNVDSSHSSVDQWQTLQQLLGEMMDQLDEREQQILRARFGFDDIGGKPSFSHLGKRLGISKERVRQLAMRALEKLREQGKLQGLEAFC